MGWRRSAELLLIRALETNIGENLIEIQHFHSGKCIWQCRLRNGGNIVSASICKHSVSYRVLRHILCSSVRAPKMSPEQQGATLVRYEPGTHSNKMFWSQSKVYDKFVLLSCYYCPSNRYKIWTWHYHQLVSLCYVDSNWRYCRAMLKHNFWLKYQRPGITNSDKIFQKIIRYGRWKKAMNHKP